MDVAALISFCHSHAAELEAAGAGLCASLIIGLFLLFIIFGPRGFLFPFSKKQRRKCFKELKEAEDEWNSSDHIVIVGFSISLD